MTTNIIPLARISDVSEFTPPVETTISHPTPWRVEAANGFHAALLLDANGEPVLSGIPPALALRIMRAVNREHDTPTQLLGRLDQVEDMLSAARLLIAGIPTTNRPPALARLLRELDAVLFPGM